VLGICQLSVLQGIVDGLRHLEELKCGIEDDHEDSSNMSTEGREKAMEKGVQEVSKRWGGIK
jgi:hypothetical protein